MPEPTNVLSLIDIGTPQFPRYVISNKHGQVWTGGDWSDIESDALVYATINTAGIDIQELLKHHYADKQLTRYIAPIYLDLYCDEQVPKTVVEDWLSKVARLIVDAETHGNGPMDGTLGLMSIDWTKLRKRSESA